MFWQIIAILGALGSLIAALWLAGKNGSKAAQLEALKAEIRKNAEEQERARKINDSVYGVSTDECRKRLQDLANK